MSVTAPLISAGLTALSMATGQLFFKLGSDRLVGNSLMTYAISFVKNPFLVSAIFLYASTIILWVYVLKHLPLTIAYPITAMSYILVPILSIYVLGEKITLNTAIGSFLIIGGIALTQIK